MSKKQMAQAGVLAAMITGQPKLNGEPEWLSISRIHEEKSMETLKTGEKFTYVDMDVVNEYRHSIHIFPKEVWGKLKKKYYKEKTDE